MPFVLTVIIAPAIFWTLFFRYKDRYRPEPLKNLGLSYLFGILSAYLCARFYLLLGFWGITSDISPYLDHHSFSTLIYLIGVTGIIEEGFKLIPFVILWKLFADFDEFIDSIVYASIIALGFASYENLFYLKYLTGFQLIARAFASPLTHTVFASIWGYYFYKYTLKHTYRFLVPMIAFLIAAVLHGLFDFLSISPSLRLFSAILILVIWGWRIVLLERLHRKAVETGQEQVQLK